MKKNISLLIVIIVLCISFIGGCQKTELNRDKKLILPEKQEFIENKTWNNDMMNAYLKPYWYSREIYNETVVFVGEEGEATLMFEPDEVQSVRNYMLDTTFVDGRDYTIEGNIIKRKKGGRAPYWEIDEYFMIEPNSTSTVIGVNKSKADFDLDGNRFLRYAEGTVFTSKQLAVTYRHSQLFDGVIPQHQPEKLTHFLGKLKISQPINVMVYGDSVAVGCSSSGTIYGGNINPKMPNYAEIICSYIENAYNTKINLENQAVGGWKVVDCINNYDSRLKNKDIDLLILHIGGNDGNSNETKFVYELSQFLTMFFADYPQANVILQTPEKPNFQSTWTLNVGSIGGWTQIVADKHEFSQQIVCAPVHLFSDWLESKNKRNRDWLANNINHPNDFFIRLYVQTILKIMFGADFVEESYE